VHQQPVAERGGGRAYVLHKETPYVTVEVPRAKDGAKERAKQRVRESSKARGGLEGEGRASVQCMHTTCVPKVSHLQQSRKCDCECGFCWASHSRDIYAALCLRTCGYVRASACLCSRTHARTSLHSEEEEEAVAEVAEEGRAFLCLPQREN
jgi:hypothetical protein